MNADVELESAADCLSSVVDRYVGYRMEGFPPGIHRGLPSRRLTFIISLGQPVQRLSESGQRSGTASQAFVAGLHTRAPLLPHDGDQHGIEIELTPLATRALFGVPAGELTGNVVELTDLLGGRGRELVERLAEARGWTRRFAVLDEVLAGCSRGRQRQPPPEVLHAWSMMVGQREPPGVAAIAREVGWSRRHLTEVFRREIGLPPRQFLRVVRFERCCRLLRTAAGTTKTSIALASGYYDHPHMLHEWQRLAGCSPAEWLAEEFPSIQDGSEADPGQ